MYTRRRKILALDPPQDEDDGIVRRTYLAQDDETPQEIAAAKRVNVVALVWLNRRAYRGLTPTSNLMEGTVLRLPSEADSVLFAPPAAAGGAAAGWDASAAGAASGDGGPVGLGVASAPRQGGFEWPIGARG